MTSKNSIAMELSLKNDTNTDNDVDERMPHFSKKYFPHSSLFASLLWIFPHTSAEVIKMQGKDTNEEIIKTSGMYV